MHLETFLYMLLQSDKTLPPPVAERPDFEKLFRQARANAKPNEWFAIPEQTLSIGLDDTDDRSLPDSSFGWDNEKPQRTITVRAFEAQARAVTNGEYAKYLQATRQRRRPESWVLTHPDENYPISKGVTLESSQATKDFMANFAVRTVFGPVPLEFAQDWPVMASYDELSQYAEWVGCRIPTYEEVKSIYYYSAQLKEAGQHEPSDHERCVYLAKCLKLPRLTRNSNGVNGVNGDMSRNGHSKVHHDKPRTPEHQPVQPPSQGTMPVFIGLHGCNVGFKHWHPTPVIQNGDRLAGQGEFGGVWEWTSTPLAPHDGFKAMDIYPGYTGEFDLHDGFGFL
jgi:hypothetical protein